MRPWDTQLRKGLVELSVLAALRGGEAYGYEILQRLAATEAMHVTESTIYPILARLAKDGAVSVRTQRSPAGPPRRYYQLTIEGEARLHQMQLRWQQICHAVEALLKGTS